MSAKPKKHVLTSWMIVTYDGKPDEGALNKRGQPRLFSSHDEARAFCFRHVLSETSHPQDVQITYAHR